MAFGGKSTRALMTGNPSAGAGNPGVATMPIGSGNAVVIGRERGRLRAEEDDVVIEAVLSSADGGVGDEAR